MQNWVTSSAVRLYINLRRDGAAVDTPGSTSAPRYLWPTLLRSCCSLPPQPCFRCKQCVRGASAALRALSTIAVVHALNRVKISIVAGIVIIAGQAAAAAAAACRRSRRSSPHPVLRKGTFCKSTFAFPEVETTGFAVCAVAVRLKRRRQHPEKPVSDSLRISKSSRSAAPRRRITT